MHGRDSIDPQPQPVTLRRERGWRRTSGSPCWFSAAGASCHTSEADPILRWQVADALLLAPCQRVIVGAGYDDRALRFRTPAVRFIEVDHPVTQADKRRRLDRLGLDASDVVFVAADFEADPGEAKVNRVLDPDVPTTILCESVLPYLRRSSGQELLSSLSRTAGSDVQLAADLPVVPGTWNGRLTFRSFQLYAAAVGEPVRTALATVDVAALLGEAGWREQRRITGRDLAMPASRSETVFIVAGPVPAS